MIKIKNSWAFLFFTEVRKKLDKIQHLSVLKEIRTECTLEGLMLKLKLQNFGHLMLRADSLEKNLDAGKDWRQEEMGVAEDEILEDVIYSMDMNLSKLREIVKDRKLWHATASWRIGHYWVNEQQHRVFFVFFSKAHNKQNWWINP